MINKEDTNTKKRVRYPFSCEERLRKEEKTITFHADLIAIDVSTIVYISNEILKYL